MQNENVTSILIANRDVTDEKILEVKQEDKLCEARLMFRDVGLFLYSLYFQKIKKITFLKATSCIYY